LSSSNSIGVVDVSYLVLDRAEKILDASMEAAAAGAALDLISLCVPRRSS